MLHTGERISENRFIQDALIIIYSTGAINLNFLKLLFHIYLVIFS